MSIKVVLPGSLTPLSSLDRIAVSAKQLIFSLRPTIQNPGVIRAVVSWTALTTIYVIYLQSSFVAELTLRTATAEYCDHPSPSFAMPCVRLCELSRTCYGDLPKIGEFPSVSLLDGIAIGAKELIFLARSIASDSQINSVVRSFFLISASATLDMIDMKCSRVRKTTSDALTAEKFDHLRLQSPPPPSVRLRFSRSIFCVASLKRCRADPAEMIWIDEPALLKPIQQIVRIVTIVDIMIEFISRFIVAVMPSGVFQTLCAENLAGFKWSLATASAQTRCSCFGAVLSLVSSLMLFDVHAAQTTTDRNESQ